MSHVHFPVSCYKRPSYFHSSFRDFYIIYDYLSKRDDTPGNSFPSSSSIAAPPPLETCVNFEDRSYFFNAASVSPPPATVTAWLFAIAFAIFFVPFSKLAHSKTPTGP